MLHTVSLTDMQHIVQNLIQINHKCNDNNDHCAPFKLSFPFLCENGIREKK